MSFDPPPINEVLAEKNGLPKLPWILFFNQLFEGDFGTEFSPTFVNLTEVGTPTITGRYHQINHQFCFFYVTITPATSTSATAASTYIDNFPLTFQADSVCFAVAGGSGGGTGHIVSSTNRIYVPAWTAVAVPLTIIGMGVCR